VGDMVSTTPGGGLYSAGGRVGGGMDRTIQPVTGPSLRPGTGQQTGQQPIDYQKLLSESPGYQFQLSQGENAVQSNLAAAVSCNQERLGKLSRSTARAWRVTTPRSTSTAYRAWLASVKRAQRTRGVGRECREPNRQQSALCPAMPRRVGMSVRRTRSTRLKRTCRSLRAISHAAESAL